MRIGVYFRETSPVAGGGHTFETAIVRTVLARRDRLRHQLVVLGPASPLLEEARAAGVATVAIPIEGAARAVARRPLLGHLALATARQPLTRHRARTGLDRLVDGAGLDVLWCVGPDVPSLEIPYFVTVWDLQHRLHPFFPEVSAGGTWDRRERWYARVLQRATRVVVGTTAGRDEVERFYGVPRDRMVILPHPTPPIADLPADDHILAARADRPYLFYPAQLWPHKNHVALLHAVRALEDDHGVVVDLVLVGSDKGNRDHVERTARELGIAERVVLPGFVSSGELVALYRGALALVYPTYFGPENLPPLEAFALGCPVIASDVSGAAEQLGDAAILVPPADHRAIAAAIARLVQEPGLRGQLIDRGRARAARSTPETFVDGIIAALDSFETTRATWPPAVH